MSTRLRRVPCLVLSFALVAPGAFAQSASVPAPVSQARVSQAGVGPAGTSPTGSGAVPGSGAPGSGAPGSGTGSALAVQAPRAGFSQAQVLEAEERFREGRALYESGRIDEARLKYAQAFAVLDRTNILWNLAVSEFYANRPLEAYRHFSEFVKRADADPSDVKRAREKYVPEAARLVARVGITAPAGTVVLVDGEMQPGAAPFAEPFALTPGTHTITARRADRTDQRTLTLAAGSLETVPFSFPGEPLASEASPAPRTYGPARLLTTAALGTGAAVALGVGIGFGIDSQNKKDANDAYRATLPDSVCTDASTPACRDWTKRLDDQKASATMATVGYVAAGVLATGAAVTWFLWPARKTDPSTTAGSASAPRAAPELVPLVAPGVVGALASGRF